MIKKFKIILLLAVLLVFSVESYASAAALTWSADYTVDLSSPDINLTILSGSKSTSLVVGTGSIAVVVASGDTFTVTSASKDLNVTGNTTSGFSKTCTSGVATVVVDGGPAGETLTITPSSSQCNSVPPVGGGGRNILPVVPPVITLSDNYPEGCYGGNKFNIVTGKICVNNIGNDNKNKEKNQEQDKSLPKHGPYNFGTKTLKNGSRGEAVMELQRFLNATLNLGLVVDGKLGPKTIKVIKQWQKDRGLVADGLIGAKTKAKMNAEAN
jgi:hypothetical protein